MGVAGAGKSTVGAALARELAAEFLEGDDFHPARNVEKMKRGEPLDEADRTPWLRRLRAAIDDAVAQGRDVVVACSALRRAHRKLLLSGQEAQVVYLRAEAALLRARLAARREHFFGPALLESQLAALEEPPRAIEVDASLSVEAIVRAVAERLRATSSGDP